MVCAVRCSRNSHVVFIPLFSLSDTASPFAHRTDDRRLHSLSTDYSPPSPPSWRRTRTSTPPFFILYLTFCHSAAPTYCSLFLFCRGFFLMFCYTVSPRSASLFIQLSSFCSSLMTFIIPQPPRLFRLFFACFVLHTIPWSWQW